MERDVLLIGAAHLALYQGACKEENVNVRTANDLRSTLTAIEEKAPGLILVDHEILEKRSIEICQTLKKYPGTQYIPLLFAVPRAKLQELVEVMFIPINDYIFLPLDLDDFKLRLHAQMDLIKLKEEKKLMSVAEKIEELEKLLQIFPDYNAARQELSEIYEKVGRVDDALQALLKLAKEYYRQNNFGFAMDVISRMKTMLAKQSANQNDYTKFIEALERCSQILKQK
jgi:response regulator RpfG family c-di-GMP phosphodiesterase